MTTNLYDVVLVHPPSFYDFRKRVLFPGPIANTVATYTPVFIMFPLGLISIGSYLEDHGLKVKIFNLAESMLVDKNFDVESFLQRLNADIYGIDLHWSVHSQGAIKIAEICKKYHPDALVVLGGLTATYFADEIVKNFNFIDCVVNGEGEEPLFKLFINSRRLSRLDALYHTPNLTFFDKTKKIVVKTHSRKVEDTLDSFDFTRLRLVEPKIRTLTSSISKEKVWMLPICRGCLFNCVICGGSSYSYKKLMNREKPAFRSPKKLLEDFMILDELGIDSIFLFQDIRLGGKKYVEQLLNTLKDSKWSHIKNVGLELFYPASLSHIKRLSEKRPAEYIGISISPESGDETIRKTYGRIYSNEELLKTCQHCKNENIPLGVFFLVGLGHETVESLERTWNLWEKIGSIEKKVKTRARIFVEVGSMIFLDPGSLAFDNPDKYGYRLKFKSFYEYYQAMQKSPFWPHWISYETVNFNAQELANLMVKSEEKMLEYKRKYDIITDDRYRIRKMFIELEKIFISEYEKVIKISDPIEYDRRIKELALIAKDPVLARSYILTYKIMDDNKEESI
ncbi:MAG: radical SAM protein [Candidatus Baldrarchaeia archaeon]